MTSNATFASSFSLAARVRELAPSTTVEVTEHGVRVTGPAAVLSLTPDGASWTAEVSDRGSDVLDDEQDLAAALCEVLGYPAPDPIRFADLRDEAETAEGRALAERALTGETAAIIAVCGWLKAGNREEHSTSACSPTRVASEEAAGAWRLELLASEEVYRAGDCDRVAVVYGAERLAAALAGEPGARLTEETIAAHVQARLGAYATVEFLDAGEGEGEEIYKVSLDW
jgi:hypothetical protein